MAKRNCERLRIDNLRLRSIMEKEEHNQEEQRWAWLYAGKLLGMSSFRFPDQGDWVVMRSFMQCPKLWGLASGWRCLVLTR